METAWEAASRAVKLTPADPPAAFLKAQAAFESWRVSVPLFEQALALDRANPQLVRNFIHALAAEGQAERACALLAGILARTPDWAEGHAQLATLRLTGGNADPWRSYRAATEADPGLAPLRLAWFHRLAAAREWDAAQSVLSRLERDHPAAPGAAQARLFFDCETGAAPADPAIFARFSGHTDPGLALTEIRHALRQGDPARAESIAEHWTATPHAAQFWPYRDLAWRMLDDPRHRWLHGEPPLAGVFDLALDPALPAFLRALHVSQAPYPEQSVRGGTQTARNLLLHHDPLIGRLRARFAEIVADWRNTLADDAGHPLLGRKPPSIRFHGSWSVRLACAGYHSAHTHPHGWASSAFYVAVPAGDNGGQFALGLPPPELNLGLAPELVIDPVPGRLVLFPSTAWHGTLPFAGQERLTLAFDIAPAATHEGTRK